jgi:hypothetical protein
MSKSGGSLDDRGPPKSGGAGLGEAGYNASAAMDFKRSRMGRC